MDTAAAPLPTLFLSHGSPMIALEPGATGAFFARLGPTIERLFGRPRAVLAISAHTLARQPVLLAAKRHETIHDFGGFPQALFEVRYEAPGAPELAPRVASLLGQAGIAAEQLPRAGGLDHGIWTVLMHMWPAADIPVLPLALVPTDPPAAHFALGKALGALAHEGVLILGTGSITHNLRLSFAGGRDENAPEQPECAAFRAWVLERASRGDWPALLDYRRQAPHAALMHPTDEHWLPFYAPAGAGLEPALRLHEGLSFGALAMDAYAFGPSAPALARELNGH